MTVKKNCHPELVEGRDLEIGIGDLEIPRPRRGFTPSPERYGRQIVDEWQVNRRNAGQCHSDVTSRVVTGFTLMEMIVTLGIFTMMTLIYTANFKGFQEGLTVETDADAVTAALRQMQLYALTGELIGGVRPDGGYGFSIDAPCTNGACAFTLYGNTCNPDNHLYESGCDTVVGTTRLNKVVSVSAVAPSSPLNVVFTFPTATPYINGAASVNGSVTLAHTGDPSRTKTVSVDGVSGQITIQ